MNTKCGALHNVDILPPHQLLDEPDYRASTDSATQCVPSYLQPLDYPGKRAPLLGDSLSSLLTRSKVFHFQHHLTMGFHACPCSKEPSSGSNCLIDGMTALWQKGITQLSSSFQIQVCVCVTVLKGYSISVIICDNALFL